MKEDLDLDMNMDMNMDMDMDMDMDEDGEEEGMRVTVIVAQMIWLKERECRQFPMEN